MSHIEVETASIQKKTAIARRFFVVPIMKVDCTDMALAKEVILDLDRPGISLALSLIFGDQTTIFCLETDNPVHRFAASDEKKSQATANSRVTRLFDRPGQGTCESAIQESAWICGDAPERSGNLCGHATTDALPRVLLTLRLAGRRRSVLFLFFLLLSFLRFSVFGPLGGGLLLLSDLLFL